jgi:hypothetical protein
VDRSETALGLTFNGESRERECDGAMPSNEFFFLSFAREGKTQSRAFARCTIGELFPSRLDGGRVSEENFPRCKQFARAISSAKLHLTSRFI